MAATGCGGGGSSPPVGGSPPGPVVPPGPPPVVYGQIPTYPVYTPQTPARPAAPYPVGVTIDWYVDAAAGSDGNTGSEAAPFRTLDRARQTAQPDQVIGLRRGQTHFRNFASTLGDTIAQSVVGYGDSVYPATISAGQEIGGNAYTGYSDGIFRTAIRLPQAHTPGGSGLSGSNTTYPFVRLDEEYFDWIVGGASLAEDLARLARTNRPSFVVVAKGSQNPDLRNEAAGSTEFDLYLRLAGGASPVGRNLVTMAFGNAHVWAGPLLQDLILRDAWGKDTAGSEAFRRRVPLLRRVESIGGGCHGWVGSCNTDGFRARAHPRPGMYGFHQGRALGGALNIYSVLDRRDEALELRGIDAENFSAAVYGHTGGTSESFAKRIAIKACDHEGFAKFRVRNCANAMQVDPGPTGFGIVERTDFECEVDIVGIDQLVLAEGPLAMTGGGTVVFSQTSDNGHSVAVLLTARAAVTLEKLEIYTPGRLRQHFTLDLVQALGGAVGAAALLLTDCKLPTHPEYAFRLGERGEAQAKAHLTFAGSTVLGEPVNPVLNFLPAAVTAKDKTVMAFADQSSREAIVSLLASKEIPGAIDTSVTILRSSGMVAQKPAG